MPFMELSETKEQCNHHFFPNTRLPNLPPNDSLIRLQRNKVISLGQSGQLLPKEKLSFFKFYHSQRNNQYGPNFLQRPWY